MEAVLPLDDTSRTQAQALTVLAERVPDMRAAPEWILGHRCGGAEMEQAVEALEYLNHGLEAHLAAGGRPGAGSTWLPGRDLARRIEAELGRVAAAAFDLDLLWRRYPDAGRSIDGVLELLHRRRSRLEDALARFHRYALGGLEAGIRAEGRPPRGRGARIERRVRDWLDALVDAALALDCEAWTDLSWGARSLLHDWLEALDDDPTHEARTEELDPAPSEAFVAEFLAGKRLDVVHRAGGEAGERFARFAECRERLLGEYAEYRYRLGRGAA